MSEFSGAIREVNGDGTLGEYLPDWSYAMFMSTIGTAGIGTFTYPFDGDRVGMIQDRAEFCFEINGSEPKNGRFKIDSRRGNQRSENDDDQSQWSGKTLLDDFRFVQLMPRSDPAAQHDMVTDAEAKRNRQMGEEWAAKQRKQNRKALEDEEKRWREYLKSTEDKPKKIERERQDHIDTMKELRKQTSADTNEDGKVDWRDFEGGEKWQEKMTSAPPPVPPKWKDATPGEVVLDILRDAKDRNAIQNYRVNFTRDKDSDGEPWKDRFTHRWDIGTNLLQIMEWLDQRNIAEATMSRWTLELRNSGAGKNLSSHIQLAEGLNIEDSPTGRTTEDRINCCYVVSDTGVHGWVNVPYYIKEDKERLEGFLQVSGIKLWGDAWVLGRKYIDKTRDEVEQMVFGVTPGSEKQPFDDFQVGDKVGCLVGNAVVARRVHTVTCEWGQGDGDGDATVSVAVGARLRPKRYADHHSLKALTGSPGLTITSQAFKSAPAVMFADAEAPRRPSSPKIATRAGVRAVEWDGLSDEGLFMDYDTKHVRVHASSTPDFIATPDTVIGTIEGSGSLVLNTTDFGTTQYYKFSAEDMGGDVSDVSDEVSDATVLGRLQVGDLSPGILFDETLGFKVYDTTGTETFSIDPTTGQVLIEKGNISTGLPGEPRVVLLDSDYGGFTAAQIVFYDGIAGEQAGTLRQDYDSVNDISLMTLINLVAGGGLAFNEASIELVNAPDPDIKLYGDVYLGHNAGTPSPIRMMRMGHAVVLTTNASSQDTVSLGGGSLPVSAPDLVIPIANNPTQYYVITKTSTNFVVEMRTPAGATLAAGVNRTIDWLAIWIGN